MKLTHTSPSRCRDQLILPATFTHDADSASDFRSGKIWQCGSSVQLGRSAAWLCSYYRCASTLVLAQSYRFHLSMTLSPLITLSHPQLWCCCRPSRGVLRLRDGRRMPTSPRVSPSQVDTSHPPGKGEALYLSNAAGRSGAGLFEAADGGDCTRCVPAVYPAHILAVSSHTCRTRCRPPNTS